VQWSTEAARWSLDRPSPIPVRWAVTGDPTLMDHPDNLGGTPPRGRAVGPVYRFRHADLHDHLAQVYEREYRAAR